MSKCTSLVSLKYRWASWPGRRVPPRGAELCHCLGVEEGGEVEAAEWKRNVLSSVVLLQLGMSRGRAQRGCGVPTVLPQHFTLGSSGASPCHPMPVLAGAVAQPLDFSCWSRTGVAACPTWRRCHCQRGSLADTRSGEGWLDAESILKDAGMPMPSERLLVRRYSPQDDWLPVHLAK